jgi:hypothetical protein
MSREAPVCLAGGVVGGVFDGDTFSGVRGGGRTSCGTGEASGAGADEPSAGEDGGVRCSWKREIMSCVEQD